MQQTDMITEKDSKNGSASYDALKLVRHCLAGRLFPGIAHNINTPLQIITMQIEFLGSRLGAIDADSCSVDQCLKIIDGAMERLDKMDKAVESVSGILNNVSLRYAREEECEQTLFPVKILEDEIMFCKSDMFFKHHIEISRLCTGEGFRVKTRPLFVRDMFCAILLACTERLRDTEKPELVIRERYDINLCEIRFEISAFFEPLPDQDIASMPLDMSIRPEQPLFLTMLEAAARSACLANAGFAVERQTVLVTWQKQS